MDTSLTESVPSFDLYATLNVAPDAPTEAILAGYRAQIRLAHPDLVDLPGALDRAKRINIARDWLLDPTRRRRYDGGRTDTLVTSAARRQAARPEFRHERAAVMEWSRSPARGDLELFVLRCGGLERREIERLTREFGKLNAQESARYRAVGERLVRRCRDLERGTTATDAAERAVRATTPRGSHRQGPFVDLLRWTAFAYAVADVVPFEAAVFLGPWEMATPPSSAWPHRARLGTVAAAIVLLPMLVLVPPPDLRWAAAAAAVVGVGAIVGLIAAGAAAVGCRSQPRLYRDLR